MASFAALGGVHVRTDLTAIAQPVSLEDEHGPVHLYGIPYIHPSFLAAAKPDFDGNTHRQALTFAMDLIRADAAARGGRFIVASHCFTTNASATQEDTGATEERDIIRGGLDLVPVSVFDGPD
jgi:exonuclease SbcD